MDFRRILGLTPDYLHVPHIQPQGPEGQPQEEAGEEM